jgi:hypothetical protein
MKNNPSYDIIKYLLEIKDVIFPSFTIVSRGDANGFTVAKNIDFEISLIDNIFTNFKKILQ